MNERILLYLIEDAAIALSDVLFEAFEANE